MNSVVESDIFKKFPLKNTEKIKNPKQQEAVSLNSPLHSSSDKKILTLILK